jgi:hypothetical protein
VKEAILLADRSPSLRRRVLVELLDVSADDNEVRELDVLRDEEAARVRVDGAGTRELGFALSRLAHLGLSRGHPIVDKVARKLLRMQQHDGSWPLPSQQRGRDGGAGEGYSMNPLQTSLPLRGLAEAGYATHAACERAYEWLLDKRLEDGSWPTGTAAGTRAFVAGYRRLPRSKGCRSNTTGALSCLVHHPELRRSDAARRAADILLRRETREESTFGAEVTRLCGVEEPMGFLTFYQRFDLAFLLELCSRAGVAREDRRMGELASELETRRNEAGLYEHPVYPHLSRWLTLDVLTSLRRLKDGDWVSTDDLRTAYGKPRLLKS